MFQMSQKTEKVEVNKAIDPKIFEIPNKQLLVKFLLRVPLVPFFPPIKLRKNSSIHFSRLSHLTLWQTARW